MKTNPFIFIGLKLSMLGQGERYGLECVSGLEELASVSGDEEENGLTFALYVVQGKNNYFSLCQV